MRYGVELPVGGRQKHSLEWLEYVQDFEARKVGCRENRGDSKPSAKYHMSHAYAPSQRDTQEDTTSD